jgi:hypothetical protein
MAFLPVVLWAGVWFTGCQFYRRDTLSFPMQTLRWQTHAFYAILPMVPPQSKKALAGQVIS